MGFLVSRSTAFACVDSGWAQAYASWALVALTFFTLLALCKYAWDTRQIARVSIEQLHNAQMPYLALVQKWHNSGLRWAVENQGNSVALNIKIEGKYSFRQIGGKSPIKCDQNKSYDPMKLENNNTIPAGAFEALDCPRTPVNEPIICCKIEYNSLEGRRFLTEVVSENDTLVTQFKAL
jgi:hypothetical protein